MVADLDECVSRPFTVGATAQSAKRTNVTKTAGPDRMQCNPIRSTTSSESEEGACVSCQEQRRISAVHTAAEITGGEPEVERNWARVKAHVVGGWEKVGEAFRHTDGHWLGDWPGRVGTSSAFVL
jgi:hypothetical protein